VSRVEPLAKTRDWQSPVKYFEATLSLTGKDPGDLKPGQKVRAVVRLDEADGVLAIPRGAVFENWVVSEVLKYFTHRGQRPQMFFYRDHSGGEVDLLIEHGSRSIAVEIKSGATPLADFAAGLERFEVLRRASAQWKATPIEKLVVYGGSETQHRTAATFLSWSDVDHHHWLKK